MNGRVGFFGHAIVVVGALLTAGTALCQDYVPGTLATNLERDCTAPMRDLIAQSVAIDQQCAAAPALTALTPTSNVPEDTSVRFASVAEKMESLILGMHCPWIDKDKYQSARVCLAKREMARRALLKDRDDKEASKLAAEKEHAEQMQLVHDNAADIDLSMKHGFKGISLDDGLRGFLADGVNAGTPLSKMKTISIKLLPYDDALEVIQVLGKHEAIFYDDETVVMFHGFKGTAYKGTPITRVGCDYVKVVSTRLYKNPFGAQVQAFVVEPAW